MSRAVDPAFKPMKGCTELTVFRIEVADTPNVSAREQSYRAFCIIVGCCFL
jgi:hypothetical protein